MMRLSIWGLVVWAACGSKAAPGPSDPMGGSSEPAPPTDAIVVDAPADGSVDAAPLDAPVATADAGVPQRTLAFAPRPAVKGTAVKLDVKKTANVGGLAVRFDSNNHKHAVGGGSLGMWGFTVSKGAVKQEVRLSSSEDKFEAEVAAHGTLLVFRHDSYDTFTVIAAGRAGKPLDEDACAERVEAEAQRLQYPGTLTGYSDRMGIVSVSSAAWTGYCGRYTKRIWFGPQAQD